MNTTKILAGLLIVVAIGLAIMAWVLGRQPQRVVSPPESAATTQPGNPGAVAATPQLHAVVAAKAIGAGQRIQQEDLALKPVTAEITGHFSQTELVVGRTTLSAIHADAAISEQQLINGLALQIEVGQRAVSIAVKEAMAAGNHVRPGDFVDVFFTLDSKNEATPVDTQTRLLLARSRVLAYGSSSVDNPPPTAAQRKAAQEQDSSGTRRGSQDGNARPENAQTALLSIPLQDVERLALAEKYGQLTLALRHPDDLAIPDPALFAALPTALQPVAHKLAKGDALQGADKSFAGLRLKDLASGADARNTSRSSPSAARTYVASPPAPAPRPRSNSVEIHQGANVQTVSY